MPIPKVGDRVVLWTRPATDVVVILGEGTYQGTENVNSYDCPVVKLETGNKDLDNPREIVVHYENVWVKQKDEADSILSTFDGQVRSIDIERWLDPNFQTYFRSELGDPTARAKDGSALPAIEEVEEVERENETGLEKVARLMRKRRRLQNKRKLYQLAVDDLDTQLTEISAEMKAHKEEILQMLADDEEEGKTDE